MRQASGESFKSCGDWHPTASIDVLRVRAAAVGRVRKFFEARGVLEVETPLLSEAGTVDLWIDSFEVRSGVADRPLWLQTSPEFHMKRLLAAGSGAIWQMGKAFRDEPTGERHAQEFTIVEWYRPGWTLDELCREIWELCQVVVPGLPPPVLRTYRELFAERAGVDPFEAPVEDLRRRAVEVLGEAPPLPPEDRDGWLDLLLVSCVEPGLGDPVPVFVIDYPASKAALARIDPGPPAVARRAELYWKGVELCNAYDELLDPAEQEARFVAEANARRERGKTTPAWDDRLVAALQAGVPPCSGVALGFDRLMMLAQGTDSIAEVMAFIE